MMDVHDEKAAVAGEDTDSSRPVSNAATTKDFRATDTTEPRKRVQHISKDQYPHGLKLVLLAGASIVAVFLIALDQVSNVFPPMPTPPKTPPTQESSKLSSAQPSLKSQTSSTASTMCLGMPRPTL